MQITRPCYCSREDVKRALDVNETARNDGQVDRAIEAASDGIDGGTARISGIMRRRFYPQVDTRSFDWPNQQYARPWRLWLDQHELISITSLTSGGTTIPASDYFLYPGDGPPYTRLEIDLDSSAAFSGGSTHQRAIAITGTFGFSDDEASAGTLTAAVSTTTATTITVSNGATVGVGHLIRVDNERMLITGRSMVDTGQNLGANLDASKAVTTVPVGSGAAFNVGETILIDSERMLITDIAGNNLIVQRTWDGSVLAAHTSSADVYASRTLTVIRGAVGTTAATHADATAVARHVPPALIRDLAVADAVDQLLQETAGYARKGGVEDNSRNSISVSNIRTNKNEFGIGLPGLRERAVVAYARRARVRAV